MEPSYSIAADMLAKFHTSSELIQALWLVAVPVTVLGVAFVVGRVLIEALRVLARRGEPRGRLIYGVCEDAQGRLTTHRADTFLPLAPPPRHE